MKFTLNWNITTYEATATGGCEVPTILTLSWELNSQHTGHNLLLAI